MRKSIILLAIALFVTIGLTNRSRHSETLIKEEVQVKPTVNLSIDSGENEPLIFKNIEITNSTPYSILAITAKDNALEIVTEEYDFGIFVESINGKPSSSEFAWIYFVNGESGQVAADKMQLSSGDLVEWKYIKASQ